MPSFGHPNLLGAVNFGHRQHHSKTCSMMLPEMACEVAAMGSPGKGFFSLLNDVLKQALFSMYSPIFMA